MSWNLLIHHDDPESGEALPLGGAQEIRTALDTAFPGLRWSSPLEAELPVEGGFVLTLTAEGDTITDIYTDGGYQHLRELAALCRREDWALADAQEGEDLDLDDPYATFGEQPA